MLKAIAVDDEPIALEIIRRFASDVPFINLVQSFTDGASAVEFYNSEKADLLFLDIHMPDISGLELIKLFHPAPLLIFTTAYSEHAVKGFELNAVDYLLKPFSFERFEEACRKVFQLMEWRNQQRSEKIITVKSGTQQVRISVDKILYVQSAGNYMQFVLADEKLLVRLTMNELQELLPGALFTRIHRSYIVANWAVSRMDRSSVLVGDVWLPVGAAFSEELRKLIS